MERHQSCPAVSNPAKNTSGIGQADSPALKTVGQEQPRCRRSSPRQLDGPPERIGGGWIFARGAERLRKPDFPARPRSRRPEDEHHVFITPGRPQGKRGHADRPP